MKRNLAKAIALVALCAGTALAGSGTDSKSKVKAELERPVVRGAIVFKQYCKLCHGERGDGRSRASKLYGVTNLQIANRTKDYYEKIVRMGGQPVGRSPYMPMWGEELSDEQINDVVSYLSVVRSPVARGEAVYKGNCILCHGVKGDGKGRASVLYEPPPANLVKSDKNDDYKRMIITLGGKAMGRSEAMPVWGQQLSAQEIDDVVTYLGTIVE